MGMCGIVGYLRKRPGAGEPSAGAVTLEMLRALGTRGPDSAGIALFGAPRAGELKVRVQTGHPERDPDVVEAIRRVAEVLAAARLDGCLRLTTSAAETESL